MQRAGKASGGIAFDQRKGITNPVVDASVIEGKRRQRRAKSDGVDVRKLWSMLLRLHHGARDVWRVVHVPTVAAEAGRHLPRDLETLKQERASTTTRRKGVLSSQGRRLTSLSQCPAPLDALRLWDGAAMPSGLRRRVLRVWAQHQCLRDQMAALAAERRALLHSSEDARLEQGRPLMPLKGIGINGAWGLGMAFFGWRAWQKRREVGGVAGFTPTPYHSGARAREHGITTSGNRHVRGMTTEWAWSGRRDQPASALRGWGRERCGSGGKRWRRIGMVAVARQSSTTRRAGGLRIPP
jgi:transposase